MDEIWCVAKLTRLANWERYIIFCKYFPTLNLLENVICFSHPFSQGFCALLIQNRTQSLTLTHTLTHTHIQSKSVSLPQLLVCILFPKVLIVCLAQCPAIPSSLCPLCPEQIEGRPTPPPDWRLLYNNININMLYNIKGFLFCPV